MARRQYQSGSSSGEIIKWARGRIRAIEAASDKALAHAASQGEELTKQHIATRGTQESGKAGRIESRDMIDAVGSYVAPRGDNRTQIGFGWVGEKKPYFLYQEGGFYHTGAQRMVEGMYALADAADQVMADLELDIDKGLNNAKS